ncbi:hypothetical protein TIFTF001_043779 [Ficus carica]|uniref:Uncharacterized protein n=1 Tax=Ficus carica TaxID=3494 RepID=A0AA87YXU2_FICCA|nr:hypothetical protein TIFTF001_043779 [Ficus carica]
MKLLRIVGTLSRLNDGEQMARREISKARCRLMKARSNGWRHCKMDAQVGSRAPAGSGAPAWSSKFKGNECYKLKFGRRL